MARSVDLVNAIVAHLNTGIYPQLTIKAKRRAVPFYDVSEMQGVEVSVFTGTRQAERSTREDFLRVYKPVVAIQKKLVGSDDAAKLAESDGLQNLVEAIEERLEEQNTLAGMSLEGFGEEGDEDTYNFEALRNLGVFSAMVICQYMDA